MFACSGVDSTRLLTSSLLSTMPPTSFSSDDEEEVVFDIFKKDFISGAKQLFGSERKFWLSDRAIKNFMRQSNNDAYTAAKAYVDSMEKCVDTSSDSSSEGSFNKKQSSSSSGSDSDSSSEGDFASLSRMNASAESIDTGSDSDSGSDRDSSNDILEISEPYKSLFESNVDDFISRARGLCSRSKAKEYLREWKSLDKAVEYFNRDQALLAQEKVGSLNRKRSYSFENGNAPTKARKPNVTNSTASSAIRDSRLASNPHARVNGGWLEGKSASRSSTSRPPSTRQGGRSAVN